MKLSLTLALCLLSMQLMASTDCFLDYHQVCGKTANGEFVEYLNQCHMKEDGATAAEAKNCEVDHTRSPASVSTDVFGQIDQVENEIAAALAMPEPTQN